MKKRDPAMLVRRLGLSRLALRIAGGVGGAMAVLGLALGLLGVPLWASGLFAAASGLVAYAVAHRLLAFRLHLARSTLKQIRKHQFENLEAAHTPRDDELGEVIWQVYRTGLAQEKEIRALRKMEDYRREFLGNVSHELKTPIFAVQGFAETLLNGALDDPRFRRSFVEKILRNTDRLNNLTRDLSEISRLETGELKMTMAPFDLWRTLGEVAESLEPLAQSRGVVLQCRAPEGLPPIWGDRERIRQVLLNLVTNAVAYNNPGGHVDVVARRLPSGEVKVSVVDDGIGIASEDVPRLTERFYRADKSRSRNQGGTGLGLAIVKHILAAHERALVVESVPGKGSTFGFTLPTAKEPARLEAEVRSAEAP